MGHCAYVPIRRRRITRRALQATSPTRSSATARSTLVIVPGWFSHVDMQWEIPAVRAFIGELVSFARVILYDKLGTGLSDPVDGVPTVENRVDDLRAVMDAAE